MEITLLYVMDLIGTFSFALSGALHAARKRLDLFGIFITAFLTALGGGTTRDVLLGNTPVAWVRDLSYISLVLLAVIICTIAHKLLIKISQTLFLFDSIGIGVFTIVGIRIALSLSIHVVIAVPMGVVTAVFGGILRDVFLNRVPLILRKEIYATACLIGGTIYIILESFGLNDDLTLIATVLIIIMIRVISVKYKLSIPTIPVKSEEKPNSKEKEEEKESEEDESEENESEDEESN